MTYFPLFLWGEGGILTIDVRPDDRRVSVGHRNYLDAAFLLTVGSFLLTVELF